MIRRHYFVEEIKNGYLVSVSDHGDEADRVYCQDKTKVVDLVDKNLGEAELDAKVRPD